MIRPLSGHFLIILIRRRGYGFTNHAHQCFLTTQRNCPLTLYHLHAGQALTSNGILTLQRFRRGLTQLRGSRSIGSLLMHHRLTKFICNLFLFSNFKILTHRAHRRKTNIFRGPLCLVIMRRQLTILIAKRCHYTTLGRHIEARYHSFLKRHYHVQQLATSGTNMSFLIYQANTRRTFNRYRLGVRLLRIFLPSYFFYLSLYYFTVPSRGFTPCHRTVTLP